MPKATFSPELAKAVHDRLMEIWLSHDLDPEFFLSFSLDAATPIWFGMTSICTYDDGMLILDVGEDGDESDDSTIEDESF